MNAPILRHPLLRLFAIVASLPLFAQVLAPAHAEPFQPTRCIVKVEGQGPDVIMIPGLASSAEVWRPEIDKLKARYRVHAIQVAGFAGAPPMANANGAILVPLAEEIAAYIRANRLERPALIGHSMGGLLGVILTDKNPDLVGKLMIVDSLPFYGMLFGPQATTENVAPQAAQMRDRVIAGTQAEFAASEPAIMARLVKSKGPEAQAALAAAQASDRTVVARAMYEVMTTDMRPRLPGIKTPVTVLYAFDASVGFPQAAVDGIYQAGYAQLPNKRLTRIDGAYHFLQIDQPEAFDREVQAFLGSR
jgi:pimeloyl-ACP methyl ester carboxylesterase